MAEHRERESQTQMSKILDNVEEDLKHTPAPVPAPAPTRASVVESFAPAKYRASERGDTMEQIQQDFRKAVADMENRSRALIEELKRIVS